MTLKLDSDVAQRFVDALAVLERDRDVEPMAGVFGADAELTRLTRHPQRDAREFWTEYRNMFDTIASTFTHAAEADRVVTLEWIGEGTLATGRPVRYAGVSVLEVADDKVTEFRTVYDSAAFVSEEPEHGHRA